MRKIEMVSTGLLLVVLVTLLFVERLQRFWYIGLILVGIWFAYDVFQDRKERKYRLDVKRASDRMYESLMDSIEETKLLRSKEVPTDDDIILYYKMYLKKKELEARSEWTAEDPMSFEKWEEIAKKEGYGYRYMIGRTSDAFIGFAPDTVYQRFTDYKQLVEEEDREKGNGTKEE